MSALTNLDLFEEFFKFVKDPETNLDKTIKEYGGSSFYIPSYKTTIRNSEILKEYKNCLGEMGLVKRLAREHNLTERQIYDITKEAR